MEKNDLVEYLANFYQVRVVYYADPEVDELCRKLSGCSLPDKFSVFIDNAYVRDVISGSTTGTVQRRIGFRFVNAKSIANSVPSKYDQVITEWFDDDTPNLSAFNCSGVNHAYNKEKSEQQSNIFLSKLQTSPWYSAFRSAVLESSEASDIEFFSSCISCIFLTSEMVENPSNNLVSLAKRHDERSSIRMTAPIQNASPVAPIGPSKHLLVPCARSCAVVFSPDGPTDNGSRLHFSVEQARTVLPGLLCQPIPFIPIDNSASAKPSTLIAGLFARLARDVVLPSLLMWSEKHITQLAEQLTSRRGISNSLRGIFSTGSKPSAKLGMPSRGSSGMLASSNGQAGADVVYTDESSEIQMRRLSDLALLMGAFDVAFEGYHRLKDDFHRDQAILPQATALEAAAVALLLHPQPPSRRYPSTCLKYLENALSLYQSLAPTVPRAQYLATRCGLLLADTLRSLKLFSEAAAVFARLAPEGSTPPEFELRSAVCLEQAAVCWASIRPVKVRKAALNMLLAGARYSRAGRRRHALRCYQTALPNYTGCGLALAEDHVLLTIGRQSFALRDLQTAVEAFACLLRHSDDTCNKHQSSGAQAGFLREYLYVARGFQESQIQQNVPYPEAAVIAPVPNFPATLLVVEPSVLTHQSSSAFELPGSEDLQIFANLEDAAVKSLLNSVVFRPSNFFFNSRVRDKAKSKSAPEMPTVFAGESFLLLVDVENPLDVSLVLNTITMFGRLDYSNGETSGTATFGHNEASCPVVVEAPSTLELQPRQATSFSVRMVCSKSGNLTVSHICANLTTSFRFDDNPNAVIHAHWPLSTPWSVEVFDSCGGLGVKVELEGRSDPAATPFIPGTLVPMKISFNLHGDRGESARGIKSLFLSTNRSECLQLLDGFEELPPPPAPASTNNNSSNTTAPAPVDTTKTWRVTLPQSASETSTWFLNALVRVAPNSSESVNGIFSFNILLAYEPTKRTGKKRYRLTPALVKLPICETPFLLSVAATPHPASPVGLLNVRDCLQFLMGFSASLMTNEKNDGSDQRRKVWSQFHLDRMALISAALINNNKDNSGVTSASRAVNTVVISRRQNKLPDRPSTLPSSLISNCNLATVIQQPGKTLSFNDFSDLDNSMTAVIQMAVAAHRSSIFSNVTSVSRLHGIFVFQWVLVSSCDTSKIRGCNFVVDPPLFAGDQFSSAVYAASDPGLSAKRLAFGGSRLSTMSAVDGGNSQSPVIVHLEYPQVVTVKAESGDENSQPFRIAANVFCRNRSSSKVELVDCILPVSSGDGTNDQEAFGSSSMLWLAPRPIWPVSIEPGDAICIPLVLLATHAGVFRPLPPTIDYIIPPGSAKTSVRPEFGPLIHVDYVECENNAENTFSPNTIEIES